MGQVPTAHLLPSFANERVSVDYAGPLTEDWNNTNTNLLQSLCGNRCVPSNWILSYRISVKSHSWSISCCPSPFHFKKRETDSNLKRQCITLHRANKELKELGKCLQQQNTQDSIMNFCSTQGIQWKFSLPTGPHHGSVWENGVKACKHHLKPIVGESKLTFEEMATVLCQIEACLNSRPLYTALDSNDDDGIASLTPGHFLTGRPLEALPHQVSTAPISTCSDGNFVKP